MGRVTAVFRVNELLNWEVARAAAVGEISVGDASSSKVFAADQVQHLLDELTRVVHRVRRPVGRGDRRLMDYLDGQKKRNLVLTFGGGVQEVQRELIAMFGLGLPRVPAMSDRHERIMAEADRIKALGEASESVAPYEVNQATIGTWLDAMGYDNERFRQGEAPPSMAQVWTMPGLGRRRPPEDPLSRMTEFLTERGLHRRARHQLRADLRALPPGRRARSRVTSALDSVAGPKNTAMGEGYFVTSRNTWYVGERRSWPPCCSGCSSSSRRRRPA